jgi:hypothetical protein
MVCVFSLGARHHNVGTTTAPQRIRHANWRLFGARHHNTGNVLTLQRDVNGGVDGSSTLALICRCRRGAEGVLRKRCGVHLI